MTRKKIFYICGSTNQTTQMHQISKHLPEYEHIFSPFYGDGLVELLRKYDIDKMSVACNRMVNRCLAYLKLHDLAVDYQGKHIKDYDLVLTCSDLVIPKNITDKKVMLVQEGMTDPENFAYHLIKIFPFLPRWIASTATTGLSDLYDIFCVASEGYRELFIKKGVKPEKIRVTGIPNFDNCEKYYDNDFPHKHFVLVCTSDSRETLKFENRRAFIEKAVKIADGRQLIFKLHPNENVQRATREIERYAKGALVFSSGSAETMIANCDVLITRFSSTVYVGMALGKEVYSDFDLNDLRKMTPIQNGGASASHIAALCREMLEGKVQMQKDLKMLEMLSWVNT
jgi:hypothetical protein